MCNKCFGRGFIDEKLPNGTKLVHACNSCNGTESDSRNREPRRVFGRQANRPRVDSSGEA